MKQGHVRKNWTKRWFVFRDDGTLYYFKKQPDPQAMDYLKCQGFIVLSNADVRPTSSAGWKEGLTIVCSSKSGGKQYKLRAASEAEYEAWARAIDTAISISTADTIVPGLVASPYAPLALTPAEVSVALEEADFRARPDDDEEIWRRLLQA